MGGVEMTGKGELWHTKTKNNGWHSVKENIVKEQHFLIFLS